MNKEIYVSVDVEADGRAPGVSSMLSFGSAAFTLDKELLAIYCVNLEQLAGAAPAPDVMRWWEQQPEAWAACRKNLRSPATAMADYAGHLKDLRARHGRLVFIGFPATYDFAWISWYFHRFTGANPFGISGLCLKSLAAAHLKIPYGKATKRNFPGRWFDRLPHTHVALDDAVEQGAMGINMIRETRGLPPVNGISDPANLLSS
jgi:hypothetical protein